MTNEFAIKVLAELRGYGDSFANIGFDRKEALDMAIKALEQEPCEEYRKGWYDAITTALKETHNYYTEDGVFKAIQEETLVGVGMSMQEPKTDGDYISRHEVIKIIENKLNPCTDMFKCLEMSEIKDDVEHLPSVTPQPKTGHWIITDDCERFIAKCSVCGRTEDSRMIHNYPYCHCGAKMESEKNVCKDCYYNDGEVHAECVICDRAESEG